MLSPSVEGGSRHEVAPVRICRVDRRLRRVAAGAGAIRAGIVAASIGGERHGRGEGQAGPGDPVGRRGERGAQRGRGARRQQPRYERRLRHVEAARPSRQSDPDLELPGDAAIPALRFQAAASHYGLPGVQYRERHGGRSRQARPRARRAGRIGRQQSRRHRLLDPRRQGADGRGSRGGGEGSHRQGRDAGPRRRRQPRADRGDQRRLRLASPADGPNERPRRADDGCRASAARRRRRRDGFGLGVHELGDTVTHGPGRRVRFQPSGGRMPCRPLRNLAILTLALASAAQADDAPPIRQFDIPTTVTLGVEMYRQDQETWKTTDLLLAKHSETELKAAKAHGWIVESLADRDVVRFVRDGANGPEAFYDVTFTNQSAPVLSDPQTRLLSADELSQYRARLLALGNVKERCSDTYNTIALKDPQNDRWIVWALAATKTDSDLIIIGGHFRFTISADGKTIVQKDALSKTCLRFTRKNGPNGEPGQIFFVHRSEERR